MTVNKKRILIVEDNESLSKVLDTALNADSDILMASSIKEAEEILQARKVDLILLDRMLPDGDGVTLFGKLKTSPKLQHIPVLILSGKSSASDQVDGLEIGADDYVTKPFSIVELRARVHAMLRRSDKFQH